MSYAHIVFTGIVTFVSAMGGNPMAVVAVNASKPTVTDSGTIPSHVAWIRFELAELADDSPVRPDREIEREGVSYGVVFLHGESVGVANRMLDDDLRLEDGIPANPEAPTAANQRFLYWIPRLRDMIGAMPRLNPAYMERDPDPDLVAMRFELTRGNLATTRLASDIAEFQPSGLRRAIAEEVSLDVTIDRPLVLELKKFRSGESRKLKFRSANTTVTIANTPEYEVAPLASPHVHDSTAALHYELYYRFLLDPPMIKAIPVPLRRSGPGGRFIFGANGADTGYCGPDGQP